MVNPVSQNTIEPKTTKVSIFYINDVHANIANMERTKTASDEFDLFVPSEKTDKLKFAAGDVGAGRDINLNKLAVAFENSIGIMASAGGNHEFDLKKDELTEVLKESKYKFLGLNVEVPSTDDAFNGHVKSYIQEQNGNKYGVIGLLPFDFYLHASDPHESKGFDILSLEKTLPLIQKEIDEMKKQGVNKIILLSHAGYEDDVKIAQSIEGIDVIIGGHTHNLINGIEEGKNLFYSKKTGEPTIITQAGKDGNYFGVLNLEFNEKGIITKAQNSISKTEDFARSAVLQYVTDIFLGKPTVIGHINSAEKHTATLVAENPSADFIADALKSETGVEIAIVNSANLRTSLEAGPLTTRDLAELTPFKNKICVLKLTEQELVSAIKVGAKSMTDKNGIPGLLQVSGLKYTVSRSGEVTEIRFINKEGEEIPIDINNSNPFKTYSVVTDDFVAKGGCNYMPDKFKEAVQKFDRDKDSFVINYMKNLNKSIDIKTDGRIQVVD